jgi:hypothetical protein
LRFYSENQLSQQLCIYLLSNWSQFASTAVAGNSNVRATKVATVMTCISSITCAACQLFATSADNVINVFMTVILATNCRLLDAPSGFLYYSVICCRLDVTAADIRTLPIHRAATGTWPRLSRTEKSTLSTTDHFLFAVVATAARLRSRQKHSYCSSFLRCSTVTLARGAAYNRRRAGRM